MNAPVMSPNGLQPLTLAQRDVVLAQDARLLVGAGAGSGKTSTVVQKLCYLLGARVTDMNGDSHVFDSPLSLTDLAAITFTNEAAADLKRKLRAALVASGLRHIATEVDAARIGTIHGFCADLLREFALRAGLPPSLKVLPDGEATALATDCARRAVQEAAIAKDVAHFGALLTGRTIGELVQLVTTVASESDRLHGWRRNADSMPGMLRDHERALLSIAERARAYRQEALQLLGAMDFDRMIVAVRDLLRNDLHVRHAVQRQLRLLIVDEFQDVDPAQRDLAFLLGGLEGDDPSPSRIMLVGDPKQSVYKFRRADVSLWNAVATRFNDAGVGRHLELSDNFRSRKGILSLVDTTVGERLDATINVERGRQGFEVDYRALTAAGPDAEGDRCVELLAIAPQSDGKARKADEARALEAAAVAERIRTLQATGVGFGDIAILLSAFSSVNVYRDALRALDIPVYVLRGEGFWECREVLDCIIALRAIRDAHDEVALVGFLKGPFVGVRDDTLLALRNARHAGGLRGAVETTALEPALCRHALELLARYGALRDRIPTHALLDRLVSETGFVASLLLDEERGTQAMANIRKLLRLAGASAELSLGEFLRDVKLARERNDRVGEERLYRERADVVTITTVHSSKGLEWPVVFWCNLLHDPRAQHDRLQCGREHFRLRLEEGETDDEGNVVDADYEALKRDLREEQLAELYRVWYVASTRARRLLVLSGVPMGDKLPANNSMAAALRARFPALLEVPTPDRISYAHADGTPFEMLVQVVASYDEEAEETKTVENQERAEGRAMRAFPHGATLLPPPVLETLQGRTRLSATQLMTFASDSSIWHGRYAFGFEADATKSGTVGSRAAATQGVIVHDVLERFNFEIGDIEELIESAIERHDADTPDTGSELGQSYRRRVRQLVNGAVASAEWQSLAAAESARRELTFTRILPDGSAIDGALDLVAMRDGVARILDVKTGATKRDGLLAERYRIQGAVYENAVRGIAGTASSFALLNASDGRVIEVDVRGIDVMQLVQALRGRVR